MSIAPDQFIDEYRPPAGREALSVDALRARVAERNRGALYEMVSMHIADALGKAEVDRHFHSMPERYWVRVTDATLRWHLMTVHAFLRQVEQSGTDAVTPALRFRHDPAADVTEVAVCSWDRPGLLMHIAGALTRAGFNILKADVYTRADRVALDIFQVEAAGGGYGAHEDRVAQASRLLAAAMFPDPSASRLREPNLWSTADRVRFNLPVITVDADSSPLHTMLRVVARDRVGLLFDVLRAFHTFRINVAQAIIATVGGEARDVFFVTEMNERKITDFLRLDAICAHICRETCRNAGAGLPGGEPLFMPLRKTA